MAGTYPTKLVLPLRRLIFVSGALALQESHGGSESWLGRSQNAAVQIGEERHEIAQAQTADEPTKHSAEEGRRIPGLQSHCRSVPMI